MRFLRLARVAGGTVRQFGELQVFDDEADLLKALPGGGYWLVERSDLVDPAQPLDSLLTALAHRPSSTTTAISGLAPATAPNETAPAPVSAADLDDDDDDDFSPMADWSEATDTTSEPSGSTDTALARMSWLAPAVLGYAMTTEPARRAGVRGDHEHAFAEPLIGLVQFVSQRQHLGPVPWWRHGWSAIDVFLVTQDEHLLDTDLNQATHQTRTHTARQTPINQGES